jgi:cation:H+ antiporter
MAVPTAETVALLAACGVALVALVAAASVVVERSLALARSAGLSELFVGTVVLSVGTSLPELASHATASLGILAGRLDYVVASGTVLGGNFGSSTVQQLLLTGILFVGVGRYAVDRSLVRTSYLPMLGSFLVVFVLGFDGTVSRLDGVVLLTGIVGFTILTLRQGREMVPVGPVHEGSRRVGRDLVVTLGALAVVVASASVVLVVVETLVARLRLSGSTVGVVSLGLVAALPELSTVVEAIRRQTPTLAVGTLVGSNVVNTLFGVGLGASISTYDVPVSVLYWDLPFKFLVGGVGLAYVLTAGNGAVGRREGGTLVALYFVYVAGRVLLFAG